jgi:hypothetical protein
VSGELRERARAWGGLAPVAAPVHGAGAHAETQRAIAPADPGQHPAAPTAADHLLTQNGLLEQLVADLRHRYIPAEPRPIVFNGAKGEFEFEDDVGGYGYSYGIYNPVEARVYVALAGGQANAQSRAVVVPELSAVVLPVAVAGAIRIGMDKTDLGENIATIYRFKFHCVQPFFASSID